MTGHVIYNRPYKYWPNEKGQEVITDNTLSVLVTFTRPDLYKSIMMFLLTFVFEPLGLPEFLNPHVVPIPKEES